MLGEAFLGSGGSFHQTLVDVGRFQHHGARVLEEARGMRISLRVAVGMVHPVKDGVAARHEVRRSLDQERRHVEELLPTLAHREHPMGCVPMVVEGLD
jgi:hypothetical protein